MKEINNDALRRQLAAETNYRQCFSAGCLEETRLFHVAAGEFIIRAGQQPAWLFWLARGRAKLYAPLANGRVSLIDFFSAPCFIGEIELVDAHHEARAVQAIEACWCLALPVKQCRQALLDDATFLRYLCLALSQKNYRNIVALTQNQSFPLSNRLAAFILLMQHHDLYQEKHTQVAEYMGVSYRHLLYVFAQFIDDGLLEKSEPGYRISNKAAIVRLAREMDPENKFQGLPI